MTKRDKNANKALHIICLLPIVAFVLNMVSVKSYASGSSNDDFSLIEENMEGILSDFSKALPEGMESFSDPYTSSDAVGIVFLLENIISVVKGEIGAFVAFFLSLLGMSLLMSLASLQEGELGRMAKNAVFLVISALIVDKVFGIIGFIGESLSEINEFFSAMIPITTAVNALGVSPGVATAQAMGMSLTLQIYSFFSGKFLYSFIGVMLVLSALCALDTNSFGKINSTVRRTFVTVMGILTAFIGATFSLQTLIASSADSWTIRGAKHAATGMIPLVGGSISSALSILASGVSYMKGVIGGGAIAVIISVAIVPLISLILYRCCFNAAILCTGICTSDGAEGVLGAFVSVFDALIAVYSLTVTIYVLQLAVFLKGGVGLA